MPDTTITPTDVIAAYGSYYQDRGQSQKDLLMRPFFPFGTREAFTNFPTNDTKVDWSGVEVGEILQPYQDAYTPKGSVVFKPVTVSLAQVKVDQKFNPNKLVNTWLGFLTNNKTDRKTWPFIRWIIDVYLMQQLLEDMETKAIYTGDQSAIVPGTAGAAADCIDGIKKLLNDGITAGSITPINTGALAADPKDFCTQVEEFVKQVPKRFWKKKMTLNMSPDNHLKYVEGKDQKYNTQYAKENVLATVKNFTNITVADRQSMDGSDKIWMTPIENVVFPVKGFANASGFELESVDREVKIWTDFWFGLGFLLKDMVFTNDVEL
jgi:hypothetical protein